MKMRASLAVWLVLAMLGLQVREGDSADADNVTAIMEKFSNLFGGGQDSGVHSSKPQDPVYDSNVVTNPWGSWLVRVDLPVPPAAVDPYNITGKYTHKHCMSTTDTIGNGTYVDLKEHGPDLTLQFYCQVQHTESGKMYDYVNYIVTFNVITCNPLPNAGGSATNNVRVHRDCSAHKVFGKFIDGTHCFLSCYTKDTLATEIDGPTGIDCVGGEWMSDNETITELPACTVIRCDGRPDVSSYCYNSTDYQLLDPYVNQGQESFMKDSYCFAYCMAEEYCISPAAEGRRKRDVRNFLPAMTGHRNKRQVGTAGNTWIYDSTDYTCNKYGEWETVHNCSGADTAWRDNCYNMTLAPVAHGKLCCFAGYCYLDCEEGYTPSDYYYDCSEDTYRYNYAPPSCTATCYYPWQYTDTAALRMPDCPYEPAMMYGQFELYDVCTFECDYNYQLSENSSRFVECEIYHDPVYNYTYPQWELHGGLSAAWPLCEAEDCPAIDPPNNGHFEYNITDTTHQTATLVCWERFTYPDWARKTFTCWDGIWNIHSTYDIQDCQATTESVLELPMSIEYEVTCGSGEDTTVVEFEDGALVGNMCIQGCNCSASSITIQYTEDNGVCFATATFALTLDGCDQFKDVLMGMRSTYTAIESVLEMIPMWYDQDHNVMFSSPNTYLIEWMCQGGATLVTDGDNTDCVMCARGSEYNPDTGECDVCPDDSYLGRCEPSEGDFGSPVRRRRGSSNTTPYPTSTDNYDNYTGNYTDNYDNYMACMPGDYDNRTTMIQCMDDVPASITLRCNVTCDWGYVRPINVPKQFTCDYANDTWSINVSPSCVAAQNPQKGVKFSYSYRYDNQTCNVREHLRTAVYLIYGMDDYTMVMRDWNYTTVVAQVADKCPMGHTCRVGFLGIACDEEVAVTSRRRRDVGANEEECNDVDTSIIQEFLDNATDVMEVLQYIEDTADGVAVAWPWAVSEPNRVMDEIESFRMKIDEARTYFQSSGPLTEEMTEQIDIMQQQLETYYLFLKMILCKLDGIEGLGETLEYFTIDIEGKMSLFFSSATMLRDTMEPSACMTNGLLTNVSSEFDCSTVADIYPTTLDYVLSDANYTTLGPIIAWLEDGADGPFPIADGYDITPDIENVFMHIQDSMYEMSGTDGSMTSSSSYSGSTSGSTSGTVAPGNGDAAGSMMARADDAGEKIADFYALISWMLCGLLDNEADYDAVQQSFDGINCKFEEGMNLVNSRIETETSWWLTEMDTRNTDQVDNTWDCFRVSQEETGYNGHLGEDTVTIAKQVQNAIDGWWDSSDTAIVGDPGRDDIAAVLKKIADLPVYDFIEAVYEEAAGITWSLDETLTDTMEIRVATYIALLNGFRCQIRYYVAEHEDDEEIANLVTAIDGFRDRLNTLNCEMQKRFGKFIWRPQCKLPDKHYRVKVESAFMFTEPSGSGTPSLLDIQPLMDNIAQEILDEGHVAGTAAGNNIGGVEAGCPYGQTSNENGLCYDVCTYGAYNDVKETCEFCGDGTVYDNATNKCEACPEGESSTTSYSDSVTECRPKCPPGRTSADGLDDDNCRKCPKGEYQNEAGKTSCKRCPGLKSTFTEGNVDDSSCSDDNDIVLNGFLELENLIDEETSAYTLGVAVKFTKQEQYIYLEIKGENLMHYWSVSPSESYLSAGEGYARYLYSNANGNTASAGNNDNNGKWRSYHITYDILTGELKLYRDGQLQQQEVDDYLSTPPPTSPGPGSRKRRQAPDPSTNGNTNLQSDATLSFYTGQDTLVSGLYFAQSVQTANEINRLAQSCDNARTSDNRLASDDVSIKTDTFSNTGFEAVRRTCADVVNACDGNGCENGARCVEVDDEEETAAGTAVTAFGYTCECPNGKSGSYCDEDAVEDSEEPVWEDWYTEEGCSASCDGNVTGTLNYTRTCTVLGECTADDDGNMEQKEEICSVECPVCPPFNESKADETTDASFSWTEGTVAAADAGAYDLKIDIECIAPKIFAKIAGKSVSPEDKVFQCGPATDYEYPSRSIPTCVASNIAKSYRKVQTAQTDVAFNCSDADLVTAAWAEGARNASSCSNCTITCTAPGCSGGARRRRRRAAESNTVTLVYDLDTSGISDADIANMYATNQVPPALTAMVNDLAALDLSTITDITVVVGGISYAIDPASIIESTTGSCTDGSYSDGAACVPCGAGTYHDVKPPGSGFCIECDIGGYQPDSGQTACLACPSGTTTTSTGSIPASRCVADTSATATTQAPTTNDESDDGLSVGQTVGIAVGTSVGVAVVGAAVFVGVKVFVGSNAANSTGLAMNTVQPHNVTKTQPFNGNHGNANNGVNNMRFHTPPYQPYQVVTQNGVKVALTGAQGPTTVQA